MNTGMASFDTTVRQMTEMSQWPKTKLVANLECELNVGDGSGLGRNLEPFTCFE